jgi:predicted DNA-binding transcriptional regulator YafY
MAGKAAFSLVVLERYACVIGHDLRLDALRAFVIGRIQDPEILDGTFVRPKDFRITDYLRSSASRPFNQHSTAWATVWASS